MTNYDFQILQYNELELLTRDLFQAEFNVYIESFRDGRDLGIDLRFGSTGDDKTVVQVKRYKEWKDLKQNLKQEVEKVQRLAPRRYMISTSVALSPENKAEIMQMFSPYIIDAGDIYGRDDLNNLIGKHNSIERKYYKLWLASVDILQAIANRGVVNRSKFELDQIREEIGLYVQNDSFRVADDILKEQRYVIISGIPGIGKTTLARMLSYHLLAQGYEEFVYVAGDLDDATTLFQEGRKQVFFFDDFLGANVFEPSGKGFDKRLIAFIDAIRRAKDKVLILTTREYILSEAKSKYEVFKIRDIDIAKCTVDLSSYSRYVRANILYNHLAEANLPNDYIEQLLANKQYRNLIDHPNYNPRIIEAYIDNGAWKKYPADQFVTNFKLFFDKPMMVWEYAFTDLDVKARYALIVLTSMGDKVFLKDWKSAFYHFCKETYSDLELKCGDHEWSRVLRILEDCFIRTKMYDGDIIVSHFNPSVRDFIVAYLNDFREIQRLLIKSTLYMEQLYTIFKVSDKPSIYNCFYVNIEKDLWDSVIESFEKVVINSSLSCELSVFGGRVYRNQHCNKIWFYLNFSSHYRRLLEVNKGLFEKHFELKDVFDKKISFSHRTTFVAMLDWQILSVDLNKVVDRLIEEIASTEDCRDLLEMLTELGLNERLKDQELLASIETIISCEIDSISKTEEIDEVSSLLDDIDKFLPLDNFNCNFLEWLGEVQEALKEYEGDYEDDGYDREFTRYDGGNDDISINEMMSSLRVK